MILVIDTSGPGLLAAARAGAGRPAKQGDACARLQAQDLDMAGCTGRQFDVGAG